MKKVLLVLCLLLSLCYLFAACKEGNDPALTPDDGAQNEEQNVKTPENGEETSTPAPHTHSWSVWQDVIPATCGTKGVQKRSCTCGEFETQEISIAAAHIYGVDNRCTLCHGLLQYTEGLKYTLNSDGESYTVTKNTALGSPSLDNVTDLVIPWYYEEKPVTIIGRQAFMDTAFTSVQIPPSVTCIDVAAFRDCENLTSIVIPSSVINIGDVAFMNCDNLLNVGVETDSQLTSIGDDAFCDCKNLTSITIPSSVISIGESAFFQCNNLTAVHITDIAAWCSIEFGDNFFANPLYYAKNLFLNGSEISGDIVIPEEITEIAPYAFYRCNQITSVTIPSSVIKIGYCAFMNCSNLAAVYITDLMAWINIDFGSDFSNPLLYANNLYVNDCLLTTLEIPSTVTTLKKFSFAGWNGASVKIHANVTGIGYDAFSLCQNLTAVYITDLTAWMNIAFANDSPQSNPLLYAHNLYINESPLTDLEIPSSVTVVKEYTFAGWNGESVKIHANVTSIGETSFMFCADLTSISVESGNTAYHEEGNCLIKTEDGVLVVGCNNSEIPTDGSVTSVGLFAFYGRGTLASIVIPSSVTSIGEFAFCGCSNLTSVTFESIEGWTVRGTSVDVSVPTANADLLKTTYFSCERTTSE